MKRHKLLVIVAVFGVLSMMMSVPIRQAYAAQAPFVPPSVFKAAGPTVNSIQGAVDEFRAALGGIDNLNAPGQLGVGRREINWDGGGATTNTTGPETPFETFLNTRGARFTTKGTGLSRATSLGLAMLFKNPDLPKISSAQLSARAPVHPSRQQYNRGFVLRTRYRWRYSCNGHWFRRSFHRC